MVIPCRAKSARRRRIDARSASEMHRQRMSSVARTPELDLRQGRWHRLRDDTWSIS
jgi:hypothetical protein